MKCLSLILFLISVLGLICLSTSAFWRGGRKGGSGGIPPAEPIGGKISSNFFKHTPPPLELFLPNKDLKIMRFEKLTPDEVMTLLGKIADRYGEAIDSSRFIRVEVTKGDSREGRLPVMSIQREIVVR